MLSQAQRALREGTRVPETKTAASPIESIALVCVCGVLVIHGDEGVHIASVMTFLMRCPASDTCCQDLFCRFLSLHSRKSRKHTATNRIRFLFSDCNAGSCTLWHKMLKYILKVGSQKIYQLQKEAILFTRPPSVSAATVLLYVLLHLSCYTE